MIDRHCAGPGGTVNPVAHPWFRLYAEFGDDPKIQMLPEALQRRFVMLLCLRCREVLATLNEDQVAFHLRISPEELQKTKLAFIEAGFIDEHWEITNWNKRQFISDNSTEIRPS